MEGTTCKVVLGSISSLAFKRNSTCLVTATNSVTCKNFGLAKDLVSAYPYGDVAGLRYTKPGVSYACERDRGVAGTAILSRGEDEKDMEKPVICTLVSQYGIGDSIERNVYAQASVQYSSDVHHVNNLRKDTEDGRLDNFSAALRDMKDALSRSEYDFVKYVLLPAGIGRRGQIDKLWLSYYLPCISSMSGALKGKTVCIVIHQDVFSTLGSRYEGDEVMSNLVKSLTSMEVLRDFEDMVEAPLRSLDSDEKV